MIDLTEDHVVVILYNMICAMKFLHRASVVHRDLKPGNILVDGSCQIVLCDFGLARSLPSNNEITGIKAFQAESY